MVFSFQFLPQQQFLTPLDVVNFCLASINREPVDSLQGNEDVDVGMILNELNAANMDGQMNNADGWFFNSFERVTLPLNVDGTISLPLNTLAVRQSYWARDNVNPIQVCEQPVGKLYDMTNNLETFMAPVVVDMVILQDFTQIPQAARNYIGRLGAYRFQAKKQSNQLVTQVTQKDVLDSLAQLQNLDGYSRPQNSINANKSVNYRLYGWGVRRNRGGQ